MLTIPLSFAVLFGTLGDYGYQMVTVGEVEAKPVKDTSVTTIVVGVTGVWPPPWEWHISSYGRCGHHGSGIGGYGRCGHHYGSGGYGRCGLWVPVGVAIAYICPPPQGTLIGQGLEHKLPTVALLAHYDAMGLAPVSSSPSLAHVIIM